MKAVCAWCQREGQPPYLGEREPFEDTSETHGVCRRHQRQIVAALPSQSFPGTELLLVVRASEPALYEHLERAVAGIRAVTVIVDRRRAERRRHPRKVPQDRRRLPDRRLPRGEVYAMGYTSVRFRQGSGGAPARSAAM